MSLYQTLYYMSLVGWMAGLFSWACAALVAAALPSQTESWVPDLVAAVFLGAFIGGLTVGFSDKWSGNRVMPRWVVSGTLIGIFAGLLAGGIQIPITKNLQAQAPVLNRLIAWMLVGSFIGLGLGLRWVQVNRARVVHAFAGGLIGGALGGLIFAGLGSKIPDLSQALGYVVLGVGICFGITLAPILLRDGVLQFVSSGDPRAQSKFGRTHKEWELQQGDSYVVGSQNQDLRQTRYRPNVGIFIPDAAIAPQHAILFGKDGRFFLARHSDTGGQSGLARFVTRVRGKTVTSSQELRHNDDILVGRTALRFVTRKKE
ncbi:MAG TPA: FHA domain-containing protein [Bryobacteraceae bacterium]|nr:FHA domain-containing protein [Bryobacteraceae bacterium]